MRLKILLPHRVLINRQVVKVIAEADNGSFCLLPLHVDFVAALIPGILSFETQEGRQVFAAVDGGILIKMGSEVLVSTGNAVTGMKLEELRQVIDREFHVRHEREQKAMSATAKLEANLIRRLMDLEKI
jgi:F-type H+-transporting ATPase subunit epsilon